MIQQIFGLGLLIYGFPSNAQRVLHSHSTFLRYERSNAFNANDAEKRKGEIRLTNT